VAEAFSRARSGLRAARITGLALAATLAGCDHPTDAGSGYRVAITPSSPISFRVLGDTLRLSATVTGPDGAPSGDPVSWRSLGRRVASVDQEGVVTALASGTAAIVAAVQAAADTVSLVVDPVVAEVRVDPVDGALAPRGVVALRATAWDSAGNRLSPDGFTWASSDEATAWMDGAGRAFGRRAGPVTFTAATGGVSGQTSTTVGTVSGRGPFSVWSADSTVITGELDIPRGSGPHPAMVRVHGAGPRTRTSGLFASSTLVPAGFALLRYDKRGVGASEGVYAGIGTSPRSTHLLRRLGDDAAAWTEFLTHHESVDPERLGLLGVSQGGWINVIAAGAGPAARYMINVVGTTISLGQQIHYQNLTGSTGNGENQSGLTDEELFSSVEAYDGPMGYDPDPELRTLSIPGLWVLGTRDYLVPYGNTVATLEDIVAATGRDYSVFTLRYATHGTRHIGTGELIPWWDVEGGGFDWLAERGFR